MRKIKHFAGYGSIKAEVSSKRLSMATNTETVVIKVVGNHEYGLKRMDSYDVFNWLVVRFLPQYKERNPYTTVKHIDFNFLPDIDGEEAGEYIIDLKWEDK